MVHTLTELRELSNALAPHTLYLLDKRACYLLLLNVVAATNTLATDQDIWYSSSTSELFKQVLKAASKRMFIEFHDMGTRGDGILVCQDALRFG